MPPSRSWLHKPAAFQLLESKLPVNWFLRVIAENLDEMDCLLEVVHANNELKGASAWIRLIVKEYLPFNEQGLYELSAIQKPATQYENRCDAPFFIVVADLDKKKAYFLPVDYYIQRHFSLLLENEHLACLLDSSYLLEGEKGIMLFQWHLQQQLNRQRLENEIVLFLVNYATIRDHPELLQKRRLKASGPPILILPTAIDRNFNFLCHYFQLDFPITHPLDLVFHAGARDYNKTRRKILFCIAALLREELSYWSFTNRSLYYYLNNIIQANT